MKLAAVLLSVNIKAVCGLASVGRRNDVANNCCRGLVPPSEPPLHARRSFLLTVGSSVLATAIVPAASWAQERSREPSAPVEALLPATRLKLLLDRAHALTSALPSTKDKTVQYETLKKVDDILGNPPKLFVSETLKRRSDPMMAQVTTGVSTANKAQYKSNRADLSLGDRVAAMLNQADVERQWGMLQFQESKLEQSNEVRAAFNVYTSQLEFGESYLLTASKEERKRMIRNDELPSLTAVITSDLDLRDLYRNEFLTVFEDAKAEIVYQLKQAPEELDTADVVDLMNRAYVSFTKWFDLIPAKDVQEALDVVTKQ